MENSIIYEKELSKDERIINVRKASTPEAFDDSVTLYAIRYISQEYEVEGYAAFPKNNKSILKGLIFNRGGNKEEVQIHFPLLCKLANAGFAVFASQYRGNFGGTGKEDYGGEDVNDVISMIDIILDLSFIDKKGVYMIGASRGGLMTYRACSIDNRIIAAAIISGLADCFDMYNFRDDNMKAVLRELIGGSPTECPQEYIKRSAVYWADKIKAPLLLCHGTADTRIRVEQAYNMVEKLKEAHKEYKLIIYEKAEHSLKGTTWIKDTIEWLRNY